MFDYVKNYQYNEINEFIQIGGNNMNSLLKEAIDELKNIHCGEVFLLKELFKGYEWNRLEMNIRLKLGKLFLYEVVTNPNLNVEVINKNSAYQQIYKKK